MTDKYDSTIGDQLDSTQSVDDSKSHVDDLADDADQLEDNEWLRSSPKPKPKLFAYNWAQGYVSTFRSTPTSSLQGLFEALHDRNLISLSAESNLFLDLGCGNGIVNIEIAKRYGIKGIGVDLDGTLLKEAQLLASKENVSDLVSFLQEDLLTTDLQKASIIFMYLLPQALEKIKNRLEEELEKRKQSNSSLCIIVEQWEIPNWEERMQYNHQNGQFRVYK